MKKYALLPALICGVTIAVSPALRAQDTAPATGSTTAPAAAPDKGQHKGGDMLARLTKELSLTDDQQTKIKAIFEASHPQMQALKNDTTLTDDQKKAKFKELREANNTAIKAVLTADQVTKFEALQQQWQDHRKGTQSS